MPFPVSLLTAVVAVGTALLAYGVGSLLQAMAARRNPDGGVSSLLLSPLVWGGLTLDVVGFLAGALALTELPLFFVQGASSASILVTALLASLLLHERPDWRETLAMPMVLAGLVALALAAEPGPAVTPPTLLTVGLLVSALLFGCAGWWYVRCPSRISGLALAMLAGLSYGCASLAARAASAPGAGTAVHTALLLAVVVHALQGVGLVTVAMRRAPVNTVTSALFATEAVGPAAMGLLVLGDRVSPGLGWAAALGFGCLVVATLLLSWQMDSDADDERSNGTGPLPRVNLLPALHQSPGEDPRPAVLPTPVIPRPRDPLPPVHRTESRPPGRHRRAG